MTPDYNKIYKDLIEKKFPDKKDKVKQLLSKPITAALDVILINTLIFGSSDKNNQKYRSYDEISMKRILQYQHKHQLNNTQTAKKFKISRNTLSQWKKNYI